MEAELLLWRNFEVNNGSDTTSEKRREIQGDHTRRLRKLHAAQKAAAARMLQGAWRRCATRLSPEMRAKRRKQRQKEASRVPTMGGAAAASAAYQYGGGASAGSTAAKLLAEGGDEGVKKLSQKFGGGGVLGKMGSFVMARGKSQDSMLVQGAPAEPAAAAPYLYSGQVSAPPSREASPPKGAVSDSSPLLSPPMGAISDIDELCIGEASPPKHKKPGYVPPKQWRPPLQMLLHQHNGRIIAIPHVDVLTAWSTSAAARSSPHEPTRAHTASEARLLAQGFPLGPKTSALAVWVPKRGRGVRSGACPTLPSPLPLALQMHSGNAQTKTLAESLLFYRSMNVDHGLGAARTLTSPIKQGPRAVSNPDAVKRAQAHRLLTGHGSLAARRGENCTNENNSADTTCTCATCTGRAQHRWLAQQEKSRPESPVNDTDDLSTDAAPAAAERPRTAPEAAVPAGANRKARASFLPKKGIFSKKSSSSQELGSDSVRVAGEDSPARAIREDAANQLQLGV